MNSLECEPGCSKFNDNEDNSCNHLLLLRTTHHSFHFKENGYQQAKNSYLYEKYGS